MVDGVPCHNPHVSMSSPVILRNKVENFRGDDPPRLSGAILQWCRLSSVVHSLKCSIDHLVTY